VLFVLGSHDSVSVDTMLPATRPAGTPLLTRVTANLRTDLLKPLKRIDPHHFLGVHRALCAISGTVRTEGATNNAL
jgi:hypothetical protein